ncbi:MAG: LysR substrate-binding domain-containing protein [Leisingera sp.]
MWSQIPPLSSLKLFDTVVRHRNMTRAAKEAGVSQSAVSQSIRQLEDFVQVPLLDRSTRPMKLTEDGERFHRTCIEMLSRIAHSVDEMRLSKRRDNNALTVSCNLGFATYWLMPRLNYFSAENPEIAVHVMAAYQGAAGLHGDSDVAIRFGNGRWRDGDWQLLFRETLIPICSPRYLEKEGRITSAAMLAGRRLIDVETSDPDWLGWDEYFKAIGQERPALTGCLRFGNYVQAVQASLAGEGIMLGWRSVVGDQLKAKQLTVAFNEPAHLSSGYYFKSARHGPIPRCAQSFLGWLGRQADETCSFGP